MPGDILIPLCPDQAIVLITRRPLLRHPNDFEVVGIMMQPRSGRIPKEELEAGCFVGEHVRASDFAIHTLYNGDLTADVKISAVVFNAISHICYLIKHRGCETIESVNWDIADSQERKKRAQKKGASKKHQVHTRHYVDHGTQTTRSFLPELTLSSTMFSNESSFTGFLD